MATLIVSYSATKGSRFDQQYYLDQHIPIVRAAWEEFGLLSAEALFPADETQPFVAVGILRFRDQASIDAALGSAGTGRVIGDIANFTDIGSSIFRASD